MITELPVLSENWPYSWDWTKSNYHATAEQTQQAYNTLVNKGLCVDFSKDVWNDLTEVFRLIAVNSPLGWNEAYGEYNDCQISESLGVFTSDMFNAMVLNINRLGIFHWSWENRKDLPGYLGRRYVRGYSDYGSSADLVYGSYILELAEKLNQLVLVLQDAADFAEHICMAGSVSNDNAELFPAPGGVLEWLRTCSSYEKTAMAVAVAVGISGNWSGNTYHDGEVTARYPEKLESAAAGYTLLNAKIALAKRQDVQGNGRACTYSGTELIGSVFGQRLYYIQKVGAKYISDLRASFAPGLEYREKIGSYGDASVTCIGDVMLVEGHGQGDSHTLSELVPAERMIMEAGPASGSLSLTEMILRDKNLTEGTGHAMSWLWSRLEHKQAQYFRRSIKSSGYQNSRVDFSRSAALKKAESSFSYQEAVEATCKAEVFGGASGHAETLIFGLLKSVIGAVLAVDAKVASHASAEITDGIPAPVSSTELIQSYSAAGITECPNTAVTSSERSEGASSAEICTRLAAVLEKSLASYSKAICELDIEYAIKEVWTDPVQTGSNLYIRNVYMQFDEDTNVHIGHKFIDAEQNGTNLHLKSVYIQNQEGSDLSVGSIFYEAEQTESNVYIRSVGSLKGV